MNALVKYTTESPYGKSDECAKLSIFDTAEWFILSDTMTVGLTYTFSAWIKSDAEGSFTVGESYIKTTTKWERYKATFTADDVDLKLIFSTPGTYYLYNSQLEIGTVATDWTQAPEDLEDTLGEYYTKKETNSIIQQTSENIVLAVESTFTKKLENYYTREETESAIEMTAESIDLSVSKKIESVNDKLKNYYTKEETESAIEMTADNINLSVTSKIESVQVGGRNLLLKSNPDISTDTYAVHDFYFGNDAPIDGETYTLTVKGLLGDDRTFFTAYNSGGRVQIARLADKGNGTYSATSTWKLKNASDTENVSNAFLRIYQAPSTGTSSSHIEWAKLERGNKSTDWSPAPEKFDEYYTKEETAAAIEVKSNEIDLSVTSRIESVKVGGRNLLLKSNSGVDTDVFGMSNFYFGNFAPIEGETYTVTISGLLGMDRTKFSAYNSGNDVKFADLKYNGDGTYSATGTWRITDGSDTASNTYLRIFHFPETGTSTSYIDWIQLERGNKATDWSLAPEEMATAEDIGSVRESMSELTLKSDEISALVKETKKIAIDGLDDVNNSISELTNEVSAKMTSKDVELQISSAMKNGTHKVTTSTGFTFDEVGLTIEKTNSEIKTQITEDGMAVYQNDKKMLVANKEGVEAQDLTASTYLIVGGRSRFENYGTNRTGCFWIGGG